jgi:hypothetical protein
MYSKGPSKISAALYFYQLQLHTLLAVLSSLVQSSDFSFKVV